MEADDIVEADVVVEAVAATGGATTVAVLKVAAMSGEGLVEATLVGAMEEAVWGRGYELTGLLLQSRKFSSFNLSGQKHRLES